jgi:hypothetical protein
MVANPQTAAIAVTLRTRPQRSASTDTGSVIVPTIKEVMATSEPSWVSVSAHCVLSSGTMAKRTVRDAKSDSISANVNANTLQA